MGAAASYTFTNVTQDHNLSASFARENQPPTADAGPDQNVIVVSLQNQPPTADDVYSIVQGVQQKVSAPGILANDSAASGQTLSSILVSDPGNGSLMLNADGSFSYTPLNNFVGTDSFTYFANDGTRDSNSDAFVKIP